ncbi:hypothetical protein A1Q2_04326 [Trichosporon asahii var. asahii CBS 8904]|uniref:Protein mago nashi n=1 Tax=Trichosporon asahii var. asahii (strain CBS 8904) TaxID=1220162 RepID=K1WIX6_TRIAC|nr:hypothetical protein A1Q2_04326 [Trichosporon asahii var. asahii CBS 8904]
MSTTIEELQNDPFYLRTGHQGQHGHEFLEFEYTHGRLRYANNSNYRNDSLIRKEGEYAADGGGAGGRLVDCKRAMRTANLAVISSDEIREDDAQWPKKNVVGRQELEVRIDKDHISFELTAQTAKIGSLADVNDSEDAEGLRVFYYLVQDLKCFVLSLITLHFKIKPSEYPMPELYSSDGRRCFLALPEEGWKLTSQSNNRRWRNEGASDDTRVVFLISA